MLTTSYFPIHNVKVTLYNEESLNGSYRNVLNSFQVTCYSDIHQDTAQTLPGHLFIYSVSDKKQEEQWF